MNPDDTSNKSTKITLRATRNAAKDSWGPCLRPNQIVNSLKMQIRRIGCLSESDERARNSLRLFFFCFLHTKAEHLLLICIHIPNGKRFLYVPYMLVSYISSASIYFVDD